MSKIEITEEELNQKIEDAVQGLKTKNAELLGELKKARKSGDITPDALAAVEEERDKAQSDFAALTKETNKLRKLADETTKKFDAESAYNQKLLIDSGLVESLTKAKVNPHHMKAVQALLRSQLQVVTEGDARTVKMGDKNLAEGIQAWANSEEGKHFVLADNNTGGGANGGAGAKGTTKTVTRSQFDAMTADQKMTHSKEGGSITD